MTELLRVVDFSKSQGTVSRASHRLMREDTEFTTEFP